MRAVNDRFAASGTERSDRDGATIWTSDGSGTHVGPLNMIAGAQSLHIVPTQPGSFAYANNHDTLAWLTDPGGDTLANDPTFKGARHVSG